MNRAVQLSVNVDHIATLRQARGVGYPDPVEAARVAEGAGASGITVHLRGDRRHIQDDDVRRLRRSVSGKLNLEMATTEEMLAFALEVGPDQVTLVPERLEEVTTEGGLDVVRHGDEIRRASERLTARGIAVSIFLDPDSDQLEALVALNSPAIEGFEINTDSYTRAQGDTVALELAKIIEVASRGGASGLRVYAGHGLTTHNVTPVAEVLEIEELNIGHWLVSRASIVGMRQAVEEMLAAMRV